MAPTDDDWRALVARVEALERALGPGTELVKASSTPVKTTRGCRLSESWYPSQQAIDSIRSEFPFIDPADLRHEHSMFLDYWVAIPGQRGTKLNWDATWRNWMRKAFAEARYDSRRRTAISTVDQKILNLQAMKE